MNPLSQVCFANLLPACTLLAQLCQPHCFGPFQRVLMLHAAFLMLSSSCIGLCGILLILRASSSLASGLGGPSMANCDSRPHAPAGTPVPAPALPSSPALSDPFPIPHAAHVRAGHTSRGQEMWQSARYRLCRRYVHGDVKPENLCLGAECNGAQNRLFLLDLGLASRWRFLRTPASYSQRPDDFRCH